MAEVKNGFPFDILWVAEQCGLLGGKARRSGAEINLPCPLCGDKGTHFAINIVKNTWNCPRCGTGGGLVDLYAQCRPGGPTDRKAAARELFHLWESGSGNNEKNKRETARRRREEMMSQSPSEKIAPIERRDAAYRALLDYLPGLTEEHEQNLRERGLTYRDIERLGFKSLVTEKKLLLAPRNLDTADVAGFYTQNGRRFVNVEYQGILIPYRDLYGRIGMMEIRMFGGKRRYLRFSSGREDPETGRTGCTKSVSTVHHVGIDPANPPSKVYLTEGGLKADAANALTGYPFLAVAGVNNPRGLAESLQELKALGLGTVVMAFDMDLWTNPNVRKAMKRTVNLIKELGLQVKYLTWNPAYKGVDDFFLAKSLHERMSEEDAA